jgi:NADPH:quinone reductase-like Zn-dependent oxidoreductase
VHAWAWHTIHARKSKPPHALPLSTGSETVGEIPSMGEGFAGLVEVPLVLSRFD